MASSEPLLPQAESPRGAAGKDAGVMQRPKGSTAALGVRSGTRGRQWLRRAHALIGLVSCLNLLVLLTSGFLLQHREGFGLEERSVSRAWLPETYRPQDGPDGVRADIVITDLHSGRLIGSAGMLVLDVVTLGWFALLLSGLLMYGLGLRNGNGEKNGHRTNGT